MATLSCPACGHVLSEKTFPGKLTGPAGQRVDVTMDECTSCEGIWFDEAEIEQTMGAHTPLAALASGPGEQGSRGCVHGHGPMKVLHVIGTEIDTCEQCAGIWLDAGELKAIFAGYSASHETDSGMTCATCGTGGFAEADLNYGKRGMVCNNCIGKEEEWGAWSKEQEKRHHHHHDGLTETSSSDSNFNLSINGINITGLFSFFKGLFGK